MEKNTKAKAPQSKKLTNVEKELLLILVKAVQENYDKKLQATNIDEMFKQLITEKIKKYEEIKRKLS